MLFRRRRARAARQPRARMALKTRIRGFGSKEIGRWYYVVHCSLGISGLVCLPCTVSSYCTVATQLDLWWALTLYTPYTPPTLRARVPRVSIHRGSPAKSRTRQDNSRAHSLASVRDPESIARTADARGRCADGDTMRV